MVHRPIRSPGGPLKITRLSLALALALFLATVGCNYDPLTVDPAPATLQIVGVSDTILFGATVNAGVTVLNGNGLELTEIDILWRTSNPEILAVASTGEITGIRPGNAFVYAQTGMVTDSMSIHVSDRECGLSVTVPAAYSSISGGTIFAGSFRHPPEGLPVGSDDLWIGAGALYGTSEATTSVGYFTSGFGPTGGARLTGRICAFQDETHFRTTATLSNLDPVNSIPGLQVEQETYAFTTPPLRDFILFRYRYTNIGSAPITGFRFAMSGDFDVYDAPNNTAHYDSATQAASVRPWALAYPDLDDQFKPDSMEAGLALLSDPVGSYRAFGQHTAQRSHLYSYMTGGIVTRDPAQGADWKHMIGSMPVDLAPGETRTAWFAVAVGDNSEDFRLNAGRAGATVALIQ